MGRAGTALQAMKLKPRVLCTTRNRAQKKRTITYNYWYLNLRECSWQAQGTVYNSTFFLKPSFRTHRGRLKGETHIVADVHGKQRPTLSEGVVEPRGWHWGGATGHEFSQLSGFTAGFSPSPSATASRVLLRN